MRSDELFRRRSYSGMGHEPLLSYLYRVVGFFVSIALILGSIASITTVPVLQTSYLQAFMGATFGVIIFCTGIAVSELWAFTASRRWYNPAGAPYSLRQLTFSITGFLLATVLIVLLTLLRPAS